MRQMFDFCCGGCGSVFERLVDSEYKSVECECGKTATRMMSMPTVRLEGVTGAFPGAHDKWARIREDNARIKGARA